MTHAEAIEVLASVIDGASGPVSAVVVDTHGEVIASVAMTGAARVVPDLSGARATCER